jgi:hypothetical protein
MIIGICITIGRRNTSCWCHGHCTVALFKEVRPRNTKSRRFTPNCDFRNVQRFCEHLASLFIAPLSEILFIVVPEKVKVCLVWYNQSVKNASIRIQYMYKPQNAMAVLPVPNSRSAVGILYE